MAVETGRPRGGVRRNVGDGASLATDRVRREDLGDDTGVIYVIGEIGLSTPVKIGLAGSAKHAHKRILTFATGNFRPMETLALITKEHARWVEFRLHCALAPWRVENKNATEWFDVRQFVTHGWEDLTARALTGKLEGAGALPELPSSPEHRLDHVHGWPRHLRAVCTCGWVSTEGSVYAALRKYREHAGGLTHEVKPGRVRSRSALS